MATALQITTDPIPKLIRAIAIPISVGFFFNTMYNVVDTFFAKFLGTSALAGLTISFPIFFLIIAIGSGITTGATALISHELGAGNKHEAARYAVQSLIFGLVISIMLILLGKVLTPHALSLMGNDMEVYQYADEYLRVIYWGVPFFLLQSIVNAGLQARGDTKSFRNVLILGVILNIGLDPLFLFGYAPLGIPEMGVAGIALSTVLIQAVGMVYLGCKSVQEGVFSGMIKSDWIPKFDTLFSIAKQGIPASVSMMTMALGVFVINYFLSDYGNENALAAFGVAMRVEQIALLPTLGISTALLTIVGQNAGAKNSARIHEAFKLSLKYGLWVMIVILGIILPIAPMLIRIFDTTDEVVKIGTGYLYVEAVTFYGYILLFCTTSLLQGLKKPLFAIWIGLYRQILAPMIVIPLLGSILGLGVVGVWWSICFTTWSAGVITYFYAKRVLRDFETSL